MKPTIERTKFGSITIAGIEFDFDVLIRLDGTVTKVIGLFHITC